MAGMAEAQSTILISPYTFDRIQDIFVGIDLEFEFIVMRPSTFLLTINSKEDVPFCFAHSILVNRAVGNIGDKKEEESLLWSMG